jgi:hypothetical protein
LTALTTRAALSALVSLTDFAFGAIGFVITIALTIVRPFFLPFLVVCHVHILVALEPRPTHMEMTNVIADYRERLNAALTSVVMERCYAGRARVVDDVFSLPFGIVRLDGSGRGSIRYLIERGGSKEQNSTV